MTNRSFEVFLPKSDLDDLATNYAGDEESLRCTLGVALAMQINADIIQTHSADEQSLPIYFNSNTIRQVNADFGDLVSANVLAPITLIEQMDRFIADLSYKDRDTYMYNAIHLFKDYGLETMEPYTLREASSAQIIDLSNVHKSL